MVELTAGDPDLVTLTAASVTILAREPKTAGQLTPIQCNWGGGGVVENYNIDIDTQTRRAKVSDFYEGDEWSPDLPMRDMPPASVSLDTRAQALVALTMKSMPGHA